MWGTAPWESRSGGLQLPGGGAPELLGQARPLPPRRGLRGPEHQQLPRRQPEPVSVTPGNQAAAKKMSFGRKGSPSTRFLGRASLELLSPHPDWPDWPELQGFQKGGAHALAVPHQAPSSPSLLLREGDGSTLVVPERPHPLLGSDPQPSAPSTSQLETGKAGVPTTLDGDKR